MDASVRQLQHQVINKENSTHSNINQYHVIHHKKINSNKYYLAISPQQHIKNLFNSMDDQNIIPLCQAQNKAVKLPKMKIISHKIIKGNESHKRLKTDYDKENKKQANYSEGVKKIMELNRSYSTKQLRKETGQKSANDVSHLAVNKQDKVIESKTLTKYFSANKMPSKTLNSVGSLHNFHTVVENKLDEVSEQQKEILNHKSYLDKRVATLREGIKNERQFLSCIHKSIDSMREKLCLNERKESSENREAELNRKTMSSLSNAIKQLRQDKRELETANRKYTFDISDQKELVQEYETIILELKREIKKEENEISQMIKKLNIEQNLEINLRGKLHHQINVVNCTKNSLLDTFSKWR